MTVCLNPNRLPGPPFWKASNAPVVSYRAGSSSSLIPPGAVIMTVAFASETFVTVSGMRPATPAPTFAVADGLAAVKTMGAFVTVNLGCVTASAPLLPDNTIVGL